MCTLKRPKKISVKILSFFVAAGLVAITKIALAAPMSDAEILGVLNAINQNEINAAKLASEKQTNPEVQAYADMMKREHTDNLNKAKSLSNKVEGNDMLVTNNVQKELEKGQKDAAKLAPLMGRDFDKAYMDTMVNGHEDALDVLDDKLIKDAQNPDLINHLTETRGHVASHLEQAKSILKRL